MAGTAQCQPDNAGVFLPERWETIYTKIDTVAAGPYVVAAESAAVRGRKG
jgi:hypothetical protein